jgi:hypothetical protein
VSTPLVLAVVGLGVIGGLLVGSSPAVSQSATTQPEGTVVGVFQMCGGAFKIGVGTSCWSATGTVTATGSGGTYTSPVGRSTGAFILRLPPGEYALSGFSTKLHLDTGNYVSAGESCGRSAISLLAHQHVSAELVCDVP